MGAPYIGTGLPAAHPTYERNRPMRTPAEEKSRKRVVSLGGEVGGLDVGSPPKGLGPSNPDQAQSVPRS